MPTNDEQFRQIIARIPDYAEKHREVAKNTFGIELDYSGESVLKLDEMIKEGWPGKPPDLLDQVVLGFGSYLGETIRKVHGGDWKFTEQDGVYFDVGNTGMKIWPFAKVRKRFLNGEEDSLGYYYAFIRHQLEHPAEAPPIISPAPAKKKLSKAVFVIPAVVLFMAVVGFLGYRVFQFARYVREHPAKKQPGEVEFREADKKIIAADGTAAFGNKPEAINLAREYSKSLKILRDNFFTKGGKTVLGPMEGEFLTYCQLNDDSCVFLVHVPELRTFTDDAKKSMTDLAWINAQSVLQSSTRHPPKTLVVGVKGLLLYDSILIGDYVADPKPDHDGIKTRGSGFDDMKLFYPYFAASTANPTVSGESPPDDATNGFDFLIVSAKFGAGKKTTDVTPRVIELLLTQQDGFKIDAKTLQVDPLPGKKKRLVIRYSYQGSNYVLNIPAGKNFGRKSLLDNATKSQPKNPPNADN